MVKNCVCFYARDTCEREYIFLNINNLFSAGLKEDPEHGFVDFTTEELQDLNIHLVEFLKTKYITFERLECKDCPYQTFACKMINKED